MSPDNDPQSSGEISEVANLDPSRAETPISDGDDISGSPSQESGRVEEGQESGPDARSGREYPTTRADRSGYGSKDDRYSSGPPT